MFFLGSIKENLLAFVAVPTNQICPTAVWSSSFNVVAGVTGSYSAAVTRLTNPYDVYVDGYQNTYVVDSGSSRIIRFPPGTVTSLH